MKAFWKWFLIVLLVLVVVAAVVCMVFFRHAAFGVGFRGYGRDWGMPMMRGGGVFMGGGLMLLGMGLVRLLPLVLVGLVVWGIYRLGKRSGSAQVPAAPSPAMRACPKCGATVQEGWKHCPQCGKKQ